MNYLSYPNLLIPVCSSKPNSGATVSMKPFLTIVAPSELISLQNERRKDSMALAPLGTNQILSTTYQLDIAIGYITLSLCFFSPPKWFNICFPFRLKENDVHVLDMNAELSGRNQKNSKVKAKQHFLSMVWLFIRHPSIGIRTPLIN